MVIRELKSEEYDVLEDFLYLAIYVPEGVEPPPRDIIEKPELELYISCFGFLEGDNCLVAEEDGRIVGAVWTRIMDDYGHVDNYTPSFAISLYPEYRGRGIGTALMKEMLSLLKKQGYKKASLAVQKSNYALKLYQKTGFEIASENEEEYIMVCRISEE